MAGFKVPIICIVIGEGGSGGALALGVGNHIHMLENSTYSVISPEGAASILWKDASLAKKAAESMKITAPDLKELDVIDEIIPEVKGGAHKDVKSRPKKLKQLLEAINGKTIILDRRRDCKIHVIRNTKDRKIFVSK